ncbi:invasion associated locus B family protein [Prevotella ihumii]|nr:hypothetical protein [Prevotella ihumii]
MKKGIWLLCLLALGAVKATAQGQDDTDNGKVSVTGRPQDWVAKYKVNNM